MATIGIHDWDYFHYKKVIPNLECMKLYNYYLRKRDIVNLLPDIIPQYYTKFYIQKDYDDGIFPQNMPSNCEFGGLVFSGDKYAPLPQDIEQTEADPHIYEPYEHFFYDGYDSIGFTNIMNSAHLRLSTATDKLITRSLRRQYGIFLHDKNLILDDMMFLKLRDLCRRGPHTYHIGNKFPIATNSDDRFLKLLTLDTFQDSFSCQYNGLMSDELAFDVATMHHHQANGINYNFTCDHSFEENHFLEHEIFQIYNQVLFFRRYNIKILLTYDKAKIVTPELRNFIELLNFYCHFRQKFDDFIGFQSLYFLVRYRLQHPKFYVPISIEDARQSFQYIREHNYELFKWLYEKEETTYEGGKFI